MADTTTQTPVSTALSEEQIAALIAKHREEIDTILPLNAADQQQAVRALGLDPKALENHYQDLQARSQELERRTRRFDTKVTQIGWGALLLTGGIIIALRKKLENALIFTAALVATPLTAGFLASGLANAFLGANLRQQNKDLVLDARNALEQELAIAMENRDQTLRAPAAMPSEDKTFTANVSLKAPPAPRDASFAAAAMQEKTANDNVAQR